MRRRTQHRHPASSFAALPVLASRRNRSGARRLERFWPEVHVDGREGTSQPQFERTSGYEARCRYRHRRIRTLADRHGIPEERRALTVFIRHRRCKRTEAGPERQDRDRRDAPPVHRAIRNRTWEFAPARPNPTSPTCPEAFRARRCWTCTAQSATSSKTGTSERAICMGDLNASELPTRSSPKLDARKPTSCQELVKPKGEIELSDRVRIDQLMTTPGVDPVGPLRAMFNQLCSDGAASERKLLRQPQAGESGIDRGSYTRSAALPVLKAQGMEPR